MLVAQAHLPTQPHEPRGVVGRRLRGGVAPHTPNARHPRTLSPSTTTSYTSRLTPAGEQVVARDVGAGAAGGNNCDLLKHHWGPLLGAAAQLHVCHMRVRSAAGCRCLHSPASRPLYAPSKAFSSASLRAIMPPGPEASTRGCRRTAAPLPAAPLALVVEGPALGGRGARVCGAGCVPLLRRRGGCAAWRACADADVCAGWREASAPQRRERLTIGFGNHEQRVHERMRLIGGHNHPVIAWRNSGGRYLRVGLNTPAHFVQTLVNNW